MKKHQLTNYILLSIVILLINSNVLFAQKQITGTVTDANGETLPGVTISVKDTARGTVTDVDGSYTLSVEEGQTLVFSFIGMQTYEVTVAEENILNVELQAGAHNLEEVQVVAYGTQSRLTVTGAISSVQSEELLQSPAASVANSLAGKITGFSSVQFSGQPGADNPNIYIRGIASLSEDRAQPLMIVDGVERSFMQLDPNEIESISVLKDASATAVYGVRGANGVIIVTTKRGREGPASINASFSTGLQQPTRLLDFADSYTYAMRFTEAQRNDNPELTPEQQRFSPDVIESFRTGSDPIMFPNTDWMDYIMKPFTMQNQANVNIRGGTSRVNYFLSVGFLNQDGLFKTFDADYDNNFSFNRFNYRSNLDIKITESTDLAITTGGRLGVRNQPNTKDGMDQLFRLIYWSVPFSGPGIIDGRYVTLGTDYIPEEKKDALDAYYGLGFSNFTNNNLNFDVNLKQRLDFITQGLTFRTKLSYNSVYNHNKIRNSSVARYVPFYRGDVDPDADPDDQTVVYRRLGTDGNLGFSEGFGKGRNWYFETGFNYKRKIEDHSFGGLLLYNHNRVFYPSQFRHIPTGLVGLVGRVTYDYDKKYMIDLNVGYNGSENFIREKRYGLFPAMSLGWVLSRENFLASADFLEHLKIRASLGLVGNDKIGGNRFLYLPNSYNPSVGGYNFGTNNPQNQTGAAEGQIGNPDVTWETALKQNIGIDMVLIRNLSFSFDYFIENRKDILAFRGTVPAYVAYDLPAVNIGEVRNEGYEIDLKWIHSVSSDFRYNVRVNMSHSRNEIIFMDEVVRDEPYLYRTGHSVGQPFGYIFDRFLGEDEVENPDVPDHQYDLQPGDIVYKDLNGDGIINQNDQRPIGFPNYPEYTLGFNAGFTYKNFDFSMFWAGATNTSRILGESFRVAFGQTANRSLLQYMADGRWTPETAETATYPRLTIAGRQNNTRTSDFYLRDASYLRLKNLEVGYNIKGQFIQNLGMKNLRVYLNGYNLITFDTLEVTDPESRTGERPLYPLTRIFNAGVRAGF